MGYHPCVERTARARNGGGVSGAADDCDAADFFVLRTPLLPLTDYLAWARGTDGAESPQSGLRSWVRDPVVREALLVATPDLVGAIDRWLDDPAWETSTRMLRTLVSYRSRMSGRPTPFGLFARYAIGQVGNETRLALPERAQLRRVVRIDFDVLEAIARQLSERPEFKDQVRLRLNDSVHRVGDRVTYVESSAEGHRRRHRQIAVQDSDALRVVEEAARGGATRGEIINALRTFDEDIEPDDAGAFVEELCAVDLLRPTFLPALTGDDALRSLRQNLESLRGAEEVTQYLAEYERRLDALGRRPLGDGADELASLSKALGSTFGVPEVPGRMLQVDLVDESSSLTLDRRSIDLIKRGIAILYRVGWQLERPELAGFVRAFVNRYGDVEVPLLDALDEDVGVGFGAPHEASGSPLIDRLDSFPLPVDGAVAEPRDGRRTAALLRLAVDAVANGVLVAELSDRDLEDLEVGGRPPLPDSFVALFTAQRSVAHDAGTVDAIHLSYTLGPSATRFFGRFCQADERLERATRGLIAAEERLRPEAVFAEIVHLPDGRSGNVAARPSLRSREIPYLSTSGLGNDAQIRLEDLRVSIREGEVILRSVVTNERVLPRLASMHNTTWDGQLPVYRFLGAVQSQGCCEMLEWRWGAADALPFLPRVQRAGVVFAKARWYVRRRDLAADGDDLAAGMRAFRERWRVPRLVEVEEGDNRLVLDLETELGAASLFHRLKAAGALRLNEVWPVAGSSAARLGEGEAAHEVVLPFTRRSTASREIALQSFPSLSPAHRFALGSEWAYLKLYAGAGEIDRLLVNDVLPAMEEARRQDPELQFFFIRYADPEWHLRLRVRAGSVPGLHVRTLLALNQEFASANAAWHSHFATYDRELERYGGPECIDECERWFCEESTAVLRLLAAAYGNADRTLRPAWALATAMRLLDAAGLRHEDRLRFLEAQREAQFKLVATSASGIAQLRKAVAHQVRASEGMLSRSLGLADEAPESTRTDQMALGTLLSTVDAASTRLFDHVRGLSASLLPRFANALLQSTIHMSVNRVFNSRHRVHELALYAVLARHQARVVALGHEGEAADAKV